MIAYRHRGAVYVNLTSRCPAACSFCIKSSGRLIFEGADLRLRGEPSMPEAAAAIDEALSAAPAAELVFCGLGECVYRLPVMRAAAFLTRGRRPELPIRLNTLGLGDLIWSRPIAPELALFLDSVSISLNTADPDQWLELHRPLPEFREKGFSASREFAASCVRAGLRTRVTAVDLPEVRWQPLERFARSIGAEFLLRPELEEPRGTA